MSNNLLDLRYKSSTGIEVLSGGEIKNKDLIDLADSGLVTGKIVSYTEDSFMFQTSNLMLPNFILEGFGEGSIVVGLPIKYQTISIGMKKSLQGKLQKLLGAPEKVKYIKELLNIDKLIAEFSQVGKENIAEILSELFDKDILKKLTLSINLYKDVEDKCYLILTSNLNLNLSKFFDEYIKAIIYQNSIYRSKVGSEKMCFCPIETPIGEQMSSLINIINLAEKEIKSMIIKDLISLIEEEIQQVFDSYLFEEINVTGVNIQRNLVSYYKNVCCPAGTCALIKDTQTNNHILGYLKNEINFLPVELNIDKFKYLFEEIIELEYIMGII